ncbi:hypothetical protein D9M71_343910 [compost metagenome]
MLDRRHEASAVGIQRVDRTLLAMGVNDYACYLNERVAQAFFASRARFYSGSRVFMLLRYAGLLVGTVHISPDNCG